MGILRRSYITIPSGKLPATNIKAYSNYSVLGHKTMLVTKQCGHGYQKKKTLSGEQHKPLTMKPNGFLGRGTLSFAYSKFKPVLL